MKKLLSVIVIAATITVVLPSCSHNNDFDDVVVNQIDEPESEELTDNDQDPKGGNEKPGGS